MQSGLDGTIGAAVWLLMYEYDGRTTDHEISIVTNILYAPFKAMVFLSLRETVRYTLASNIDE